MEVNGTEVPVFQPRPLKNLLLIDDINSLTPLTDFQVLRCVFFLFRKSFFCDMCLRILSNHPNISLSSGVLLCAVCLQNGSVLEALFALLTVVFSFLEICLFFSFLEGTRSVARGDMPVLLPYWIWAFKCPSCTEAWFGCIRARCIGAANQSVCRVVGEEISGGFVSFSLHFCESVNAACPCRHHCVFSGGDSASMCFLQQEPSACVCMLCRVL